MVVLRYLLYSRLPLVLGFGLVLSSTAMPAAAAQNQKLDDKAPVHFDARDLSHDETGQIITATGDVVMTQDGRTVTADKVVYNLQSDTVVASGNVVFTDVNGDKHYADEVEFQNSMKNGFVEGLQTFLVDGSRFKAKSGTHTGGTRTVMKDASYTPCESCENTEPVWQIKASEVKHDKDAHSISYRNARFEVLGVPVAYTPYFSHPDGSVKRKSGFLTPSAGYKSDLGAFVESGYYWSVRPDQDFTLGAVVMTQESPMLKGEWRQRWQDASLLAQSSVAYSSRNNERGGARVVEDEELRGNLRAQGLWDINQKWRSGLEIDVVSDRQYLRQYDFDEKDVLENQAYVERFSGRDYFTGRMIAFQDTRVEEEREDQPNILPEIEASFLGEPGSVPLLGGRWSADINALGLTRFNEDQDMARTSLGLGWERRIVSDFGLLTTLNADARADLYQVNDRRGYRTDSSIDRTSTETRGFGSLSGQSSYPIAKTIENGRLVLEPLAALTLAPNVKNNRDIPNEDSEDIQLDVINLFESNRFPGIDRIEDHSHVTYGMKAGIYGEDGSHGDVFLGQSYRMSEDDNPFATGSGLEKQQSDVVGQITGVYQEDYSLSYRFQLDNEGLSSERHEFEARAQISNLNLSTRYLFAKGLDGTEITESREQIENAASYDITENWRVRGAARHDLGEDEGLRKAIMGLDYIGQCFSWSVTGERNLTSEVSGDSGTEVMFRIGLKNLGEFETTGISLDSSSSRDDDNEREQDRELGR